MSESRLLLEKSLEVLRYFHNLYDSWNDDCSVSKYTIENIEAYLSKPEQEPAGFIADFELEFLMKQPKSCDSGIYAASVWGKPPENGNTHLPLYAEPPARKPLSDNQILNALDDAGINMPEGVRCSYELEIARAIEKAYGIE